MLRGLGAPVVRSEGEAEKLCAWLDQRGVSASSELVFVVMTETDYPVRGNEKEREQERKRSIQREKEFIKERKRSTVCSKTPIAGGGRRDLQRQRRFPLRRRDCVPPSVDALRRNVQEVK